MALWAKRDKLDYPLWKNKVNLKNFMTNNMTKLWVCRRKVYSFINFSWSVEEIVQIKVIGLLYRETSWQQKLEDIARSKAKISE